MKARARWVLGMLTLLVACTPGAQEPNKTQVVPLSPPGLPADSFPTPDRPVAPIITDTYSNEDRRDAAGEAERVMDLLGVRPGMRVADIGAGSGYYVVRLSPRVGPEGRVYAQDIVPEYLERLRQRVRADRLSNVTFGLGDPHDPRLPEGTIDLALLVHMYHEIEQPYGLLYNLASALAPGARVAIVDNDRPTGNHGTPPALLRCELAAVGYRQIAMHDLGEAGGYLAVFEPPAGEPPPPGRIQTCPASRPGPPRQSSSEPRSGRPPESVGAGTPE